MKCGTNGQEKTSSSESRLTDDYNGVVGLMTKPESTTEARRHEEPQVNFSIATRFILVLVKITVTLRHDLVGWAERTARKMRISRNRLFRRRSRNFWSAAEREKSQSGSTKSTQKNRLELPQFCILRRFALSVKIAGKQPNMIVPPNAVNRRAALH